MRKHGLKFKYLLMLEKIRVSCKENDSREFRPTPLGMTIGAVMALHNNGDIKKLHIERLKSSTGNWISRQVWEYQGDMNIPFV